MKKRSLAFFASMVMLFTLLAPTTVFAWTDGDADPNDTPQTISGADEATVPIEGEIGTFDPTKDPGDKPTPKPTDKVWVNVTIPTKMIFASTQADAGNLIAPKYTITNNSYMNVKVSVKSVAATSGHIDDMTLNLKVTASENVVGTPVASTTLVSGNPATYASNVEIAQLKGGTASGGANTLVNTEKGKLTVQLGGTLPGGSSYDYSTTKNPTYSMVLGFASCARA